MILPSTSRITLAIISILSVVRMMSSSGITYGVLRYVEGLEDRAERRESSQ